jgi:hypothetical protein
MSRYDLTDFEWRVESCGVAAFGTSYRNRFAAISLSS